MEKLNILVADDDKNICALLELYLGNEGYKLYFAHDGSSALDVFRQNEMDLVLLDIMLPIINGWEVCKIIRKSSNVPIIMITAKDMIEDKIQGFDIGADDYIVKPFDPREVVVRIKARLRTSHSQVSSNDKSIKAGNLVLDMDKYEVRISDIVIDLKPKEIQLLHFLLVNKNIVFSRDKLIEKVWNYDYLGDTRTVDVHVKRLRENIEDRCPQIKIKTVWGVGYKIEVEEE